MFISGESPFWVLLLAKEKLAKLEERLILGEISEATYKELKQRFESERDAPSTLPPNSQGLWVAPELRKRLEAQNPFSGAPNTTETRLAYIPKAIIRWHEHNLIVTDQRIVAARVGSSIVRAVVVSTLVGFSFAAAFLAFNPIPGADSRDVAAVLLMALLPSPIPVLLLAILIHVRMNGNRHAQLDPSTALYSDPRNFEIDLRNVGSIEWRRGGRQLVINGKHGPRRKFKFLLDRKTLTAATQGVNRAVANRF